MKNTIKLSFILIMLLFCINKAKAQIKIHILEHNISCFDCFSELNSIFLDIKTKSNDLFSIEKGYTSSDVLVIWHIAITSFSDTAFLRLKIQKKHKSVDSVVFIFSSSEIIYKPISNTIFYGKFSTTSPAIVISIGNTNKSLSYKRIYKNNKPKRNIIKQIETQNKTYFKVNLQLT